MSTVKRDGGLVYGHVFVLDKRKKQVFEYVISSTELNHRSRNVLVREERKLRASVPHASHKGRYIESLSCIIP